MAEIGTANDKLRQRRCIVFGAAAQQKKQRKK